ncbi:MAG: 16S rRNA (guanine(527)-N(7))-methyltransferase RsmG [Chloroflexota bacterium]|nr:16S rRNA (guanine(527)-N(7))-methyltransferase RsmG [Chloroflexota bacterium]
MTFSPPDQPAVVADPVPHQQEREWPGLVAAAANLGVPLSPEMQEQLAVYLRLLSERSAQFNLTAIRDPQKMERLLFLDAVAMIPTLDTLAMSPGGSAPRLIDVGSGAGFPGLVLKIVRPALRVTLLDATGKKVRFLDEVITATDLTGVRAVHGRAEELARNPEYREQFNLATARAVASLPVLLELTTPFLDVGGSALLPKGLDLTEELIQGKKAARLLGCRVVSSDVLPAGDTRLVIVEKETLTPGKFPRPTGIPNQAPLGVPV